MKTFSTAIILLALSFAGASAQQDAHRAHAGGADHKETRAEGESVVKRGAPIGDSERVKLAEVLKEPRKYEGASVVIEGTVSRVCKNRGCWVEVTPEGAAAGESVRVVFSNHSFFVPKDSESMKFRAEGEFSFKKLSKEEVDHLIKDDGAKLKLNADGTADELSFVAAGVELWK